MKRHGRQGFLSLSFSRGIAPNIAAVITFLQKGLQDLFAADADVILQLLLIAAFFLCF